MDNERIKEVARVWTQQYWGTKDLTERAVAKDVLELIREVIELRVENECLTDASLNPAEVLKEKLADIGLTFKQFPKLI